MEKMNRILDDMLVKMEKEQKTIKDRIDEVIDEPCKILIEKGKNGEGYLHIEGNSLAILVALAGAEQNILKKVKCTDSNFEKIKDMIGTVDVDEDTDNE